MDRKKPDIKVRWLWLIAGLVTTTVAALGVHAAMLGVLRVPYPYGYPRAGWAIFPDAFVSTLAAIYVQALLDERFQSLSPARRGLMLFLLLATVKESLFRAAFMEIMNSNSFIYPIVQATPRLLSLAVTAALIVLAASLSQSRWAKWGVALGISLFVFLVCSPIIDFVFERILAAMASMSSPSLYDPPYDYHILIPAYLSFLEPVVASFFMASLVWKNLPPSAVRRVSIFTFLVLVLKGPVIKPLIALWLVHATAVMAFLSEAQFSFESITLGALTALTWMVATRSTPDASIGKPNQ